MTSKYGIGLAVDNEAVLRLLLGLEELLDGL
jgi:hypothetical protein